jgi:tRNA(His) 5'-end guanylyltransferase
MSQKSIDRDVIGSRFKWIEKTYEHTLQPRQPLVVRLDGNAFHTLTRSAQKPYDPQFAHCMRVTTAALVHHFHASCGYTQSDEISIVFDVGASDKNDHDYENIEASLPYNGRINKLLTVMASKAGAVFNQTFMRTIAGPNPGIWTDDHLKLLPCFDARVAGQFSDYTDVYENLMWRQNDAFKNAATMAACCHFSPRELHQVGTYRKIDMLAERGVNFDEFPEHFKRGVFIRKVKVRAPVDDLQHIPEEHRPVGDVIRNQLVVVDGGRMPTVDSDAGTNFTKLILSPSKPSLDELQAAGFKTRLVED